MSGSIVAIQTCPGHHRSMQPLDETDIVVGGIPGDTHFGAESIRQLLMIDQETLDELSLSAGEVKENLTLRGIDFTTLTEGTRLEMGTAEVEVTVPCTPCSRMDEIRIGLSDALIGRRGILARVTRPGRIRSGDEVRALAPIPERAS